MYFRSIQVLGQIFSVTVEESEEGTPLVDLVINRVEELDSNLVIRCVEQGRVLLNGKPAESETRSARYQEEQSEDAQRRAGVADAVRAQPDMHLVGVADIVTAVRFTARAREQGSKARSTEHGA